MPDLNERLMSLFKTVDPENDCIVGMDGSFYTSPELLEVPGRELHGGISPLDRSSIYTKRLHAHPVLYKRSIQFKVQQVSHQLTGQCSASWPWNGSAHDSRVSPVLVSYTLRFCVRCFLAPARKSLFLEVPMCRYWRRIDDINH